LAGPPPGARLSQPLSMVIDATNNRARLHPFPPAAAGKPGPVPSLLFSTGCLRVHIRPGLCFITGALGHDCFAAASFCFSHCGRRALCRSVGNSSLRHASRRFGKRAPRFERLFCNTPEVDHTMGSWDTFALGWLAGIWHVMDPDGHAADLANTRVMFGVVRVHLRVLPKTRAVRQAGGGVRAGRAGGVLSLHQLRILTAL